MNDDIFTLFGHFVPVPKEAWEQYGQDLIRNAEREEERLLYMDGPVYDLGYQQFIEQANKFGKIRQRVLWRLWNRSKNFLSVWARSEKTPHPQEYLEVSILIRALGNGATPEEAIKLVYCWAHWHCLHDGIEAHFAAWERRIQTESLSQAVRKTETIRIMFQAREIARKKEHAKAKAASDQQKTYGRIIRALSTGPKTAKEITEEFGLDYESVRKQLARMANGTQRKSSKRAVLKVKRGVYGLLDQTGQIIQSAVGEQTSELVPGVPAEMMSLTEEDLQRLKNADMVMEDYNIPTPEELLQCKHTEPDIYEGFCSRVDEWLSWCDRVEKVQISEGSSRFAA